MPDEQAPGSSTPPPKERTPRQLTPQQLADLEAALRRSPSAQKLCELKVERANQIGGLTLEFMRLFAGVCFGEPYMLTLEECAVVLNRPVSELVMLYEQLMDRVQPVWMATPEFQAWKASPDHREPRKADGA